MSPIDALHRRMIDFEQYAKLAPVSRVLWFTPDEWQKLMACEEFAYVSYIRFSIISAVIYAGFTLRVAK